jgi:hypothetical protein
MLASPQRKLDWNIHTPRVGGGTGILEIIPGRPITLDGRVGLFVMENFLLLTHSCRPDKLRLLRLTRPISARKWQSLFGDAL